MAFQSSARSGTAPAGVAAADISALPPGLVGQVLSGRTTRGQSARFRVRGCRPWEGTRPLSPPLQGGLRLLPHPFPAAPSARLTVCFPLWEGQRGYFVHLVDHRGLG